MSSLSRLKDIVKSSAQINTEHVSNLIDLAAKSNESMVDSFARSQEQISKKSCMSYASEQFCHVRSSLKLNEDISNNDSVSKHIVTKEMLDLYKQLEADNCERKYYYQSINR